MSMTSRNRYAALLKDSYTNTARVLIWKSVQTCGGGLSCPLKGLLNLGGESIMVK